MENGNDHSRKILVVADGDSRINWASSLANVVSEKLSKNYEWRVEIVSCDVGSAIDRFLLGNETNIYCYGIVILGFGGGANLKFTDSFFRLCQKEKKKSRPILVAGFNGICDPADPHPLLCRSGADLILVNSQVDFLSFKKWFSILNVPGQDRLILLGYSSDFTGIVEPDLKLSVSSRRQDESEAKRNIVFFAQPTVPSTLKERLYILQELKKIALLKPSWNVVVKPRSLLYEKGITHSERYYYQNIYKYLIGNAPSNFYFSQMPVDLLLDDADLCITVGSTVAITAIQREIPTLVISDFGIRREYGNHHFAGSGFLGPLRSITSHDFQFNRVDWWVARNISQSRDGMAEFVTKLEQLIAKQCSEGSAMKAQESAYSAWGCGYVSDLKSRPKISIWQRFSYFIKVAVVGFLAKFIIFR